MPAEPLVLAVLLASVDGLAIQQLTVPAYAVAGGTAHLSCDYSVARTRLSELDVKWYRGRSPAPFLVFLPHHWTLPRLLDPALAPHTQFSHSSASRLAITLTNLTASLAGLYTCKVSTNSAEQLASRRLTVIGESIHSTILLWFVSAPCTVRP